MNLTQRDIERSLRDAKAGADTAGATRALLDRAAEEALLDVAYATMDSPFGELVVAETPKGVVKISFGQESPDEVVEELAWTVSPRVLEAPSRLDPVRRELDRYFEGRLRDFKVPLDWQLVHGFQTRVLRATAAIPYGETRSYGEVAAEAGNRRAFRAAGTALGRNPLPLIVPCHRVLRSGGVIGNYGGGPEMKEALLKLEGAIPKD